VLESILEIREYRVFSDIVFCVCKVSNKAFLLPLSTRLLCLVVAIPQTYKTFHNIPKETYQKVTRFDEPYKTGCLWGVKKKSKEGNESDLVLCKFVEYFHVFPTSYLRHRKGPAVPKETCKRWMGRKSLGVTVFQTHDNARDPPFRTFPGSKTETR